MSDVETAWAKLNLSLKIIGKRPDGYHELSSLVVFAGFGDQLCIERGETFSLEVDGPEAGQILGENLLYKLGQSLISDYGIKSLAEGLGRVQLTKNLPVAAGLGGGSADAGALIRLVEKAGFSRFDEADIISFGKKFGADVPVCVASEPAFMRGIGELVEPLSHFPKMGVLMVNPRVSVATKDVFQRLDAPLLENSKAEGGITEPGASEVTTDRRLICENRTKFQNIDEVIRFMQSTGNDLTEAAIEIAPVIGEVLAKIERTEGCLIARLSGSGATCFGLYPSEDVAHMAAKDLIERQQDWWIAPTFIRPLP